MFGGVQNDSISVQAGELVGGVAGKPAAASSFTVGDFVDVAPRTWIGINRPGGRAKITNVNDDGSYDVSYIVSRDKDREVPAVFISLPDEGRSRAVKPRCRWCKCFITDCGHNQEVDEEEEEKLKASVIRQVRIWGCLHNEPSSKTFVDIDEQCDIFELKCRLLEKLSPYLGEFSASNLEFFDQKAALVSEDSVSTIRSDTETDPLIIIRPFMIGEIVDVAPRTWIGMNRPGGRAKIVKCHEDGSYDVSYIVSRDKDREVPAVFISLPDEGRSREVKPRCRWCKCFITDCGHNQEVDEEEEIRVAKMEEKELLKLSVVADSNAMSGVENLVSSTAQIGDSFAIKKRKVPSILRVFYEMAEKDNRRFIRQMNQYQRNPTKLNEPRKNRSAFYFFVKAKRYEFESELGQNFSRDDLKARLLEKWIESKKYTSSRRKKRERVDQSALNYPSHDSAILVEQKAFEDFPSSTSHDVFLNTDVTSDTESNFLSLREHCKRTRIVGDDDDDEEDDDEEEDEGEDEGEDNENNGNEETGNNFGEENGRLVTKYTSRYPEILNEDIVLKSVSPISFSPHNMHDQSTTLEKYRRVESSQMSEVSEPSPEFFSTKADERLIKRAKQHLEEDPAPFRNNTFIQPEERDVFLLPEEIEPIMRTLYAKKSHPELLSSLKNVLERARNYLSNLNALLPLITEAFNLVLSSTKSIDLHIDEEYSDETRWDQLNHIFESVKNKSLVNISKLDMAIIVIELANHLDFILMSLAKDCYDHSNFIRMRIKKLKKSQPESYHKQLYKSQKATFLALETVENQLRWLQPTLLAAQKKLELRFKSYFHETVDYVRDTGDTLSDNDEIDGDRDSGNDEEESSSSSDDEDSNDLFPENKRRLGSQSYDIERFMSKKVPNFESYHSFHSSSNYFRKPPMHISDGGASMRSSFDEVLSSDSRHISTLSAMSGTNNIARKSSISLNTLSQSTITASFINNKAEKRMNKTMFVGLIQIFKDKPLGATQSAANIVVRDVDILLTEKEFLNSEITKETSKVDFKALESLIDFKKSLALSFLPFNSANSCDSVFTSAQFIMQDLKASLSATVEEISVDPIKAILSYLNATTNYLFSLDIEINMVLLIARVCLEIDAFILNTDKLRKQYGFDLYFVEFCRFQLSCIFMLNKKSSSLKSTDSRPIQQFLSLWYEMCLSDILIRLIPRLGELLLEAKFISDGNSSSQSKKRAISLLHLFSDAISIFSCDLALNKTYWGIFNRVLFDAMRRRRNIATLPLYTAVLPAHRSFIRHVKESRTSEISLIDSLQECFTKRLGMIIDSCTDIEPIVFESLFLLLLSSYIKISLSKSFATTEKLSVKQASNWIALKTLQEFIIDDACSNSIKAVALLQVVEQMPLFAKIWDNNAEGLDLLFNFCEILLKLLPSHSDSPFLDENPSGIAKYVIFEEKPKNTLESKFFEKCAYLLREERFSSPTFHIKRQNDFYETTEKKNALKDVVSLYFKLQSISSLPKLLDCVKNFDCVAHKTTNKAQAAVFLGRTISSYLRNSHEEVSSTNMKRLQAFFSVNDQALMKFICPKEEPVSSQSHRILIFAEFFPGVFKILGYDKLFDSESENKSIYEKMLLHLSQGNSSVFSSVEWMLAMTHFDDVDYCMLLYSNCDLPVFKRIRQCVLKISQFDYKLHHVSKELVHEVVLSLTFGNEVLNRLLGSAWPLNAPSGDHLIASMLSLIRDLLLIVQFGISSSVGTPTDGLFGCCINVVRNIAISIIRMVQTDRPCRQVSDMSNVFEGILRSLHTVLSGITPAMRVLITGFSSGTLANNFSSSSSWKLLVLVVETASLCCIVGLLKNFSDLSFPLTTDQSLARSMRATECFDNDSKNGIKEFVDSLNQMTRASGCRTVLIDHLLLCVFWTPILKAAERFPGYVMCSENELDQDYKFYPVVLCVRRNVQQILSSWMLCLCTLQIHQKLSSKYDVCIADCFRVLSNLFNSEIILDREIFRSKFIRCCGFFFPPTAERMSLSSVLFGNDRFQQAFDGAAKLWIQNGRRPALFSTDFFQQLEMSSFKTSLPFLANFFSILSHQTLLNSNMVERGKHFKDNYKFIEEVKKCFPVLVNFSTQSSESVRLVRLSEVKSLKALLCGEFSRALYAEDLKPLITDFASQVHPIFTAIGARSVDKEILSIIKYFPMYFRAICFCPFATKITDWGTLLLGLILYFKSNKVAKIDDIVQDIFISMLLSLIIPMDVPNYLLIDSGARLYSQLLDKLCQHMKAESINDTHLRLFRHDTCCKVNNEQLGKLRDYLLFDESSFIITINDKRDFNQERELVAAAVSTQIFLRSKFFDVVRIMDRLNGLNDVTYTAVVGNIQISFNITEPMILSVLAGISLLLVNIFRLFWGESSMSVVSVNACQDSNQCVADLMKLVLSNRSFCSTILPLSAFDFKEKFSIDFESSALRNVLPKFISLASAFSVVTSQRSAVSPDAISAFTKCTYSLLEALRKNCVASSGNGLCSRSCSCCQASYYTQISIQSSLHGSIQRLSLLETSKKSSKYVEVNESQFRSFKKMMNFLN